MLVTEKNGFYITNLLLITKIWVLSCECWYSGQGVACTYRWTRRSCFLFLYCTILFCSFCFLILFLPLAGFPLFLLLTLYSFALRGFCDNVFLVRADCVVVLICLKLLIHYCYTTLLNVFQLKFGLSLEFSEFFDKIPVRILRDELFRVFRFSKASFTCPDISDLRKVSMQFGNFIWKIIN